MSESTSFIALLLAVAFGIVAYRHARARWRRFRRRRAAQELRRRQRAAAASQQLHRRRQDAARRNRLAYCLQVALLQLHQAPDFRRAACIASQCRSLPLQFRQQQFARFKGHITSHLRRRLAEGHNSDVLLDSLSELLQLLGVADFEAEYLIDQAQQHAEQRRTRRSGFDDELQRAHREHEERVRHIRDLRGLDEELREQLLETEDNRYRDALLDYADQSGG